ncbi:hypothetical protein A2U01_0065346, partial [Trifolium medium]|nr:hypothetical protein [Trifolium medium]
MIYLLPGDPSKPAEIEALVEEEAEREGLMAIYMAVANIEIQQLASLLLKSGVNGGLLWPCMLIITVGGV